MGVPQRFAERTSDGGRRDERELREERRSSVSLAETRADARGVPIVRGVATRLAPPTATHARRGARGSSGEVEASAEAPGTTRTIRRVAPAAVDLGEDGDRGVADRLAEAGGETRAVGPHRSRVTRIRQVHTRPCCMPRNAARTTVVQPRSSVGAGQDHERGDEADDPAEDGDALAPVSVREAADDEVAYRLEHGEGYETRLAAVGGLRELPARTVQHRQLVEL